MRCLKLRWSLPVLLMLGCIASASAQGPVILGGDDLTDHGSHSGGTNFNGWLYIQVALENIAASVTVGNDGSVAVLGSSDSLSTSGNAGGAYHYAVPVAATTTSLSGVVDFRNGAAAISQFFTDLGSGAATPAIIVSAGTGAANDQDAAEVAAMTANALGIANFVNSGGGLLAHSTGYGWLSALIPAATAPSGCDSSTLALTAAGIAAFPTLTNANIQSGPCHNHFLNHGLPVLARDAVGGACTVGPFSGVTVAESEPNDTSGTADPIVIGDDFTGSISPSAESDFVSFAAAAGQTIRALTVLTGLPDSTLTLLDTDGTTLLAFNDDGGPGLASQIIFTLPAAGTYFLQVQSFAGNSSGGYRLELRECTGITTGRDIIIGGAAVTLPGQLTLDQPVGFNLPGASHTLTANVTDTNGNPLQGITVDFLVTSGPNVGANGTDTTDAAGDAFFTYNSNGVVGLDVIEASFVDPATGNTIVASARKYWDFDCQPNGIPDTCDLDCFALECAADFPGCGGSVDADGNGVPDECIIVANLDIKPGSCPNSFNRNSNGVLPVALLGTADFDVNEVDISSILLLLKSDNGNAAGAVAPHEGPPGPHTTLGDSATPFTGDQQCDCHDETGDGFDDLNMKFKVQEVVDQLGLAAFSPGDLVSLTLIGTLLDGTPFEADDCVRLVPPGTGDGLLAVGSNLPGAWLDVSPLDLQLDGGGFAIFERTYPQTTVVTLTAPATYHGWVFSGWLTDGGLHPGQSIEITIRDDAQRAKAIYAPAPVGPIHPTIVP